MTKRIFYRAVTNHQLTLIKGEGLVAHPEGCEPLFSNRKAAEDYLNKAVTNIIAVVVPEDRVLWSSTISECHLADNPSLFLGTTVGVSAIYSSDLID
jgi:hypothetical protein